MATSGSVDFSQTRNEIIGDALVQIGAIAAGDAPSAEDSAFAARQLNRMVKAWQADGVHLWKRKEAYLFCSTGQARYGFGSAATDHAAEVSDVAFTTLTADAASGASSLTVDSTTGIAAADYIGVVLDDGTIDWDTVSAVPGAITLTGTLSGAASSGNAVFAYTTRLNRPLRIVAASRRDTNEIDTPIIMTSHEEYQRIPNKTSQGRTNNVYYQPEIPTGYAYLWPAPDTSSDRIRITCELPIEDFDASSNTADLPQEWLDALVWNLARRLMPSYGTPAADRQQIMFEAEQSYQTLKGWDAEPEPLYMQMDTVGY